jgi:hypothetical protein
LTASNATNSVLRARLSDVSWILDRKREGLGAAAISAYLDILEKVDAGTLSFRIDEQHAPLCYEARDCLRRTLQIARAIGWDKPESVAARDAVNRFRKRAVKEGRGVPVIWFSDLDLDFGVSESAEVACSVERALSANQSENTHIVADLWRLAARAYHFAKKDEDKNRCLAAAAMVVHHRAFGFRPGIGLGSPSGQVAA